MTKCAGEKTSSKQDVEAIGVTLRPKIILSPDCRRKKTEHTINTKRIIIAMTGCLQAGYSITRQPGIAILFVF